MIMLSPVVQAHDPNYSGDRMERIVESEASLGNFRKPASQKKKDRRERGWEKKRAFVWY